MEGRLKIIIEILSKAEIGCLNLANNFSRKGVFYFANNQKFLTIGGNWLTCMSANIINTKSVSNTNVSESLRKSNLLQLPFFIDAILSKANNVLIKDQIFEKDTSDNNSGYNFFKVFIDNYLSIFNKYRRDKLISCFTYWVIKRKLMWNFIIPFIARFYFQKRYPYLDRKGAAKILFKNYWYELYFYLFLLKIPYVLYKEKDR